MRVEVAVPPLFNARLVWLNEAVMPPGDESVRATVPEKPFRLLSVMVELPWAVASTVCALGLADMENSERLTVTVVECAKVPLAAVTVTV